MIWGLGRLDPRFALIAGLGFALPVGLSGVSAQQRPMVTAQNDKTEKLDALKQHDQELKATREQQRQSAETEAALKREIEQIGANRRKLNKDLIDTAARLRGVEVKIEATQDGFDEGIALPVLQHATDGLPRARLRIPLHT